MRQVANKPTFAQWVAHWWQKFDAMAVGTAYECGKCAKDEELFLEICAEFINKSEVGSDFSISEDYKLMRRIKKHEPFNGYHRMKDLPDGIRIEKINEGFTEYVIIKGSEVKVIHRADRGKEYIPSYRIYDNNDKLIAIET